MEQGRWGEVYEKLLRKRGLKRHEEIRASARREVSYEERIKGLEEDLKIIKGIEEELTEEVKSEEAGEDRKATIEEAKEEVEIKGELELAIERLEEEISKLASPEEVEAIRNASSKRLWNFMRTRKKLLKVIERRYEELRRAREDYQVRTKESEKQILREYMFECLEVIKRAERLLEEELPFKNPESFLAHALLKLREYKKQLPSDIVETEYPKTQKERIKEILAKNRLVALLGETGTGKTRLARKIAEEMTGDYKFVPGHRFITAEDLFFYRGLDVREVKPSEVPKIIEQEIERFKEEHPDLSEDEIKKYEQIITDVVKGQAASKELTTEVFLSAVLEAATEGKIVIIDEFNYIPSNLLAGLNALVEAKPGEKISVFGQEVQVKPGFGVIFTGNITRSEFQGRYLQREKIDPALVNRLNSGLIEYGSLPQANNVAFRESILTRSDIKKGETPPKRELFQIGLAILADEKGNISGPPDLLEQVWRLASEFSLLQKLYAGEKFDPSIKLPGGQDVVLKEYAISMRTFRSVLESWMNENFRYPLDWYIYDNLIRPASIISPSEAGQIFIILKERGMFFQDEKWNEYLNVNPVTYRIEGIEKIESDRESFRGKLKLKKQTYYFTPQEVAEAFLGVEMPKLEEIEGVREELIKKEQMKRYQELKERYEKIRGFIDNWEETIRLYCEDEEKILGKRDQN
ncbi:MAG: AAA family ATPase [Candidatus Aenigmatarchaeota archaeon]